MNKLLKKIVFCIGIIALMQMSMNAQNEVDALRFSEIDWQGSARFMGAGKAFGAVGAEFSALNTNPASIGLYKKSEITFTPLTISAYRAESEYNGNLYSVRAPKYNIGSVGMVLAINGISSTLWKKFQIGFGYNRVNNFNNFFNIEGRNDGKTIGSVYAESATNQELDIRYLQNPDIWSDEMWLAGEYWLISPKEGSFISYIPEMRGVDMKQISNVSRHGGNDEMVFSFGTNYDDKLFLGATLGVPVVNFTENRDYFEINDKEKNIYNMQRFEIHDKLVVKTTGINLKLGIIYQPFDFLRLGLSFHTPTYFGNVRDHFERKISASMRIVDSLNITHYPINEINYINNYNYSLSTPLRAMFNAAFFISQRAFISAEYEFVDYSTANMNALDYNFSEENRAIQNKYGACHIARIGAEINVNQVLALRAGYNYISSPYKNNINDGSKHYISAGLGFRTKYFFSDFAYALTTTKEQYWMYDPEFVNAVNNKFLMHRIVLTVGVRF